MLLRFIPKCNKVLDDFKENAETFKKVKNCPVCCNLTDCVGISPTFSSFGKGTRAGVASLSTVFTGGWLLISGQERIKETAQKKRQELLSLGVLLPGEISAWQEEHPLASPISALS